MDFKTFNFKRAGQVKVPKDEIDMRKFLEQF